MLNARVKGQAGEREFCKYIAKVLELEESDINRNLNQTREGGGDIILTPFLFEVKRQQTLLLNSWWMQVINAVKDSKLIPVVAFRQNRRKWEFLISATNIGLDAGFIHLNDKVFNKWVYLNYYGYKAD